MIFLNWAHYKCEMIYKRVLLRVSPGSQPLRPDFIDKNQAFSVHVGLSAKPRHSVVLDLVDAPPHNDDN